MAQSFIFFLTPFLYSLIYFSSQYSLFLSVVMGFGLFWSINTALFFIIRFIPTINFFTIGLVHLFCIGTFFFCNKNKVGVSAGVKDAVSLIATLLTALIFCVGSRGFSSLVPIPSSSWDMAVHYLFTTDIIKTGALTPPTYPFGFHSNASIFIKSILILLNGNSKNASLMISGYSIFLIFFISLLMGMFTYQLASLFENKHEKMGLLHLLGFVLPFVLFLSFTISILWQGFVSVLFFILILLIFIFLDGESINKKTTTFNLVIKGLIVFLLGYSYTHYLPIFLVYFCTCYFITKKKEYILFFFVYLLSGADLLGFLFGERASLSLLTQSYGWFEPFPIQSILFCFAGSAIYLSKSWQTKSFRVNILFVIFLLFFYIMIIGRFFFGFGSYSVFKLFIPLFGLCILYTSTIWMKVWYLLIKKINKSFTRSLVLICVLIFTTLAALFIFPGLRLPGISSVLLGKLSFFQNENKDIRAQYVRVLSDTSRYDLIVPIETNLNKLRWWASLLTNKTPISKRVNDRYYQIDDLDYYAKQINLFTGKKILIIDFDNTLTKMCKTVFIDRILYSKNKIEFIPDLSNEVFKRCKK